MDRDSLYQELILQHCRAPHNRGALEDADVEVSLSNPLCGDELTVGVRVREGVIEAIRFQGRGCSISQASASMMSRLVEGKSLAEANHLSRRFLDLVHGDQEAADDGILGDLRALVGVARFPVRVRCALLAWTALQEAENLLPPASR